MSFLVGEDDQQTTLELALAFIDACDGDSNSAPNSSCSGEQLNNNSGKDTHADAMFEAPLDASLRPPTQPSSQLKKQQQSRSGASDGGGVQRSKKAKSNASAVTRHRERKKAETLFLRNEVVELEAALSRMQNARAKGGSMLQYLLTHQDVSSSSSPQAFACGDDEGNKRDVIKPKQVSLWLDIAAMQARERYKAENLNMRLKDAVERQLKVTQALESVLNKKSTVYGLDLLLDDQKQLLYNDCVITQGNMVFASLRMVMQEMYFAADALFDAQSWASCDAAASVSSSTQVKEDPITGSSYVEVRTSTPLGCGFQAVGDMVWNRVSRQKADPKNPRYSMEKRHLSNSSFQKSFTMVIDGPEGGALELRGVAHAEKIDEATRSLAMWHTSLLLPGDGPRFIEKGWVAVVPSTQGFPSVEPQQQSSIYQTVYQVSCDSRGDHRTANDPRTSSLIECVLRALSKKTRATHQQMQNALSDEFAPLSISRTPPARLLA